VILHNYALHVNSLSGK